MEGVTQRGSDLASASARPSAWIRVIRALNRHGIRLLHLADFGLIYLILFALTGLMILIRPQFNAVAYLDRYAWSFAVVAAIHLLVFEFGGLYDRERRLAVRPASSRMVALVWLASLLVGVLSLMLGEFLIPRSILVAYSIIGPLGLWLNRRMSRQLRLRTDGPARLLLVGDHESVERAGHHLGDSPQVTVTGATRTVATLEAEVREQHATDVLLLDGNSLGALYADALSRLEERGVEALQLVRPQDSLLGLRNVAEIGGMPVVALSAHVLTRSQARLKRAMDLLVLLITAPITAPLFGLTALLVAIRAGRPLFFIQGRVGRDGTTFPMIKFRTMGVDAERHSGPVQASSHDPRVIPGLGWLRSTRLDELPQLINVLRGEMTIVGPRPERPQEMADYEALIPGYRRRHQVEPGITGLAQVYGYYHTHPEFKLGHDLHYLANWSPILDLQIMLRTAWVILARRL
jgi:exopolysaccharide biosynthesis polyprenyl glycosylphosphotransferase